MLANLSSFALRMVEVDSAGHDAIIVIDCYPGVVRWFAARRTALVPLLGILVCGCGCDDGIIWTRL